MQPESDRPRFDLFQFQMKMREARGSGVPVLPPAWPVFQTPMALGSLFYLQTLHGETVYKSLIQEEERDEKRRWDGPPLFAHDL